MLRKTTPFISNQKMLGGTGYSFVNDMHDGRLGKKRRAGFASENAPGTLTPCSTEAALKPYPSRRSSLAFPVHVQCESVKHTDPHHPSSSQDIPGFQLQLKPT